MLILPKSGERLVVGPRERNAKGGNYWAHIDRYLYAAKEAASLSPSAKVLDAASGSGYGTFMLSQKGGKCVGVDISREAVEYSNEAYGGPSVKFLIGDVAHLDFPDESFDLVVSFETIEHLNKQDQDRFLIGVKRVLRSGGRFIVSAPVTEGGVELPMCNRCHQYEPDPDEFVSMIADHFRIVSVLGQMVRPKSATIGRPSADDIGSSAFGRAGSFAEKGIAVVARAVRKIARTGMNVAFERFYLRYPALLRFNMQTLQKHFHLRPINLASEKAAHLVVTAVRE